MFFPDASRTVGKAFGRRRLPNGLATAVRAAFSCLRSGRRRASRRQNVGRHTPPSSSLRTGRQAPEAESSQACVVGSFSAASASTSESLPSSAPPRLNEVGRRYPTFSVGRGRSRTRPADCRCRETEERNSSFPFGLPHWAASPIPKFSSRRSPPCGAAPCRARSAPSRVSPRPRGCPRPSPRCGSA